MQWAVILLLSLLVALNSVAVIALTRQVGILHLRVKPPPVDRGPRIGGRLQLGEPVGSAAGGGAVERVLVGFVSPGCAACATLLRAFGSIAHRLGEGERLLLVSDADQDRARAYLDQHGVALPLVTGPAVLAANAVPGTPFAVVTDGHGEVLATSGVTSLEQVEHLVEQARLRHAERRRLPVVEAVSHTHH